ncbi:thiamine pyrophosphate-binding protein [Chloroflexota bacterium]
MSQENGGQLLARSLKEEGVKYVFSLTGHGIDDLYDGCMEHDIQIIDTRHEQAAALMAEGWARATGKPGVVAVTLSPGVAAMVPGIANSGPSPVVAIAGKSHLSRLDMEDSQELDQLALMKPITKWARTIYQTERVPEYISAAFRHATTGRPGPVYLDIPVDISENQVNNNEQVSSTGNYYTEVKPQGDPKAIRKAVELICKAERPLLIGGGGLWWSGAWDELRQFVELLQIPFILKNKARGVIPEDHHLSIGPALVAADKADVVLTIGRRMDHWLGFGKSPLFNEKAKVIEVDIDPGVIGQNRPVEVGIVGDARAILRQMIEEARDSCKGRMHLSGWIEECTAEYKSWRQCLDAEANSDAVPIHPARLWKEVTDFLGRDTVVTIEGGEQGIWANHVLKAYSPGHMLNHFPLGGLGAGIPFGIAAKLANPDKRVLVCCGDGAFLITGMELDTAVRHNIPIVVVVSNNGCWGTCFHRQLKTYGRTTGTVLGHTRYDKLVEALGGHGEWVEKPDDIRPALERAFQSGLPACVNIKTDQDAGCPVTYRGQIAD